MGWKDRQSWGGEQTGLHWRVHYDGAQGGAGLLPSAHPMPQRPQPSHRDRQAWEHPSCGFDHMGIFRFQTEVKVLP